MATMSIIITSVHSKSFLLFSEDFYLLYAKQLKFVFAYIVSYVTSNIKVTIFFAQEGRPFLGEKYKLYKKVDIFIQI